MPLQATEVADGIHRLEDVSTNWYMLEEGGRLTLLDAGLPADWRAFTAALGRLGHEPTDIDAVLITHHHPDHTGNAERLRSAGARVFSHPADAPYLRGERQLSNRGIVRYLWRPWYLAYMLRYVAKGITRTPAVAHLDELTDGEIVDVPGSPRVVHAPGHTAGSCALFVEDRSVVFTGDALVTLDLTRGPRGRAGPQVVHGAHTEDAPLARESLAVLAATSAQTVLPGHGAPWQDGIQRAVEIARSPLAAA
jgi:glyoxylase-like metal-dependent hydrolase (beta-lactamase superfamily II)